MKRISISQCVLLMASWLCAFVASADVPSGYYDSAKGKNKGELLQALEDVVGEHTALSYSALWDLYYESDVTSDGYVWDMYSTSKYKHGTNQCGSGGKIGTCYNREHSMPKSWFDEGKPMYTDAFHLYPTDGAVNSQRSNYPYGECSTGTRLSGSGIVGLGLLGTSSFSGYSGKVFEPDDQYKGDFARTYFYMAAAYNSKISTWDSDQLAGNSYPCFTDWSVNLLMKWHREDPVSQKEIDRNEVVYKWQKNRNPFIDYPELAEYVWGTKTSEGWTPGATATADPIIINPNSNEVYDCGVAALNKSVSIAMPLQTTGITEELTVRIQNSNFSVTPKEVSVDLAKAGTTLTVTFTPASIGSHTAELEIFNGEVSAVVTVKGECVDGIPAQEASDVTFEGFTAHWTDVDNAGGTYALTLFEDDATTVVAGYPVNVLSSLEEYAVTGLNYETDYYYQLSCEDRVSNKVKVTTASPHRILAFTSYPETGLQFSALPNVASEVQEVSIYTEYVTEKIRVSVTGNFELSMDNSNWSSELSNIDPEGETFFIRMKAVEAEGNYTGVLSLHTASLEGEEIDVAGTVAAPRSFLEDFEGVYTSSYTTGTVQGTACQWNVKQMYAGSTDDQDYQHGEKCARVKKGGYLEMAEDKTGGLGVLTFYARPFNKDTDAVLEITYSIDGGSSWIDLATTTVPATEAEELTEYSYAVNVSGNVRVRFDVTSGTRAVIDDIAISDYSVESSVTNVGESDNNWHAYAVDGSLVIDSKADIDIEVYSMDAVMTYGGKARAGRTAISLASGVYIVVSGDTAKKVIL